MTISGVSPNGQWTVHPTTTIEHNAMIVTSLFSPSRRYIITSSLDGEVKLSSATTGNLQALLQSPSPDSSTVTRLCQNPEGSLLVGTNNNGEILIWNMPIQVEGHEIPSLLSNPQKITIPALFSPFFRGNDIVSLQHHPTQEKILIHIQAKINGSFLIEYQLKQNKPQIIYFMIHVSA